MEMQWKAKALFSLPECVPGGEGAVRKLSVSSSRGGPSLGWRHGHDAVPQPVWDPAQGLQSWPLRGAQTSLSEEPR